MRILAIAHLFPNYAERRYGIFVARQLSAMAEKGAEITVLVPRLYCPAWLRNLLKKPPHYNHRLPLVEVAGLNAIAVPYAGLPGQWFNRWSGLFVYRSLRRKAVELHRRTPFDVIYATELFLNGDAARRLSKSIDIPAACLAIGSDVNVTAQGSAQLDAHFQNIVAQLDGVLACGHSIAQAIDVYRETGSTMNVHGVVDLSVFRPGRAPHELRDDLNLPRERTILLYVGYLWKRKGLLDLIEAFAEVHRADPNTLLVLCGDGDERQTIYAAAEASPARDAIRFTGSVDPHSVHRYMQACDLFVLPSHAEGMPNVVMEAMACGRPVVCTNVGGLTAALEGSDGAQLVEPHDTATLATTITQLLADPAKLQQMGVAAQELASTEFDVRRNASKILAFLEQLSDSRQLHHTDINH